MSRPVLIALPVLLLALVGGLKAGEYNLPQVADGEGIRTTFIFFNNSTTTAVVSIHIRNDDGAPLDINIPGLGEANPYQLVLPSGRTEILTSQGAGPIQTGSAKIVSDIDIGVSAIFSLFGMDGTTLITEAGVGAAQPATAFEFAVDTTGDFNTGVAVQNLGEESNQLAFQFFDLQGLPRGAPVMRTLAGNGHLSVFVAGEDGLLPQLNDNQGKMLVSAQSPVAAVTLRQKVDTGNPLTTLPVVPSDSPQTSFILPQIANSPLIQTSFVMFNLATTANANVSISLTQDDGSPLEVGLLNGMSGSQFNFLIPAFGVMFVQTDRLGELSVGAARVESDLPIGVTAIFTIFDQDGNIVTEAGVGDSPQNAAFSLPVDLTQGFDTGMALFNPNQDAAILQVDFLPGDDDAQPQGVSFQVAPLNLASFNHLAQFVSELIPDLGLAQGQLAVTSDVPVAALTLRQGAVSLTTLPVRQGVAGDSPPDPLPAAIFGVDLTSSRRIDRQLSNGFLVDGRVDLPNGVANDLLLSVKALRDDGQAFTAALDFGAGLYCVAVPRGSYTLEVRYLTGSLSAAASTDPAAIELSNNVIITRRFPIGEVGQNRTEDLVIAAPEFVEISGQLDIANLLPELPFYERILYFSSQDFAARVEVAPDFSFGVGLAPHTTYDVSAQFFPALAEAGQPPVTDLHSGIIFIGELQVEQPLSGLELAVPPMIVLAGSATQPQTQTDDGTVAARHIDFLTDDPTNLFPSPGQNSARIGPGGSYRIALAGNQSYEVNFGLSLELGSEGGQFVSSASQLVNYDADSNLDLNIPEFPPEVQIFGRLTDSQGNGVEGAYVVASSHQLSGMPGISIESYDLTDPSGNYCITTLSGTDYKILFQPRRPDLGPVI